MKSNERDELVKKSKGPVMTTLDEFYKVGPGPLELAHHRADAHHLRLLPALHEAAGRSARARRPALKVHLFGSLSATGKGHGTERAALAGIVGKEPATVEPAFLDSLAAEPDQTFQVKLGDKTFDASLKDIIYDAPKGEFPHPNTMTCKLMAGDSRAARAGVLLGRRRLHRVEGLQPPKKGQPKYPYSTMKELLAHAEANKLSDRAGGDGQRGGRLGQERGGDQRVHRQDLDAMVNIVKSGLRAPTGTLPGPIKLKTKAGDVYKRAMDDKYEASAASASSRRTRWRARKRTRAATWS